MLVSRQIDRVITVILLIYYLDILYKLGICFKILKNGLIAASYARRTLKYSIDLFFPIRDMRYFRASIALGIGRKTRLNALEING